MLKLEGARELQARGMMVGDGGVVGGSIGDSGMSDGHTSALAALLEGDARSSAADSRRRHHKHTAQHDMLKAMPALLAESSAEWVRARGIQLLIVNAEGSLKKPVNLSMPLAAGKGGHDAFRSDAVPFLSALLTEEGGGGGGGGGGGSSSGGGGDLGGSGIAELRSDRPRLVLLSDLGHQCTERESGPLLEESKVRQVLDNVVVRLCNELGLSVEAASKLKATMCVYHSFVPLSCRQPSEKDKFHEPSRAGPEWTHEWCRPRAGALRQALADADVLPHHALVVCINEKDHLAAEAASIPSIPFEHLLRGAPAGQVRLPGASGRGRGRGKAPVTFDETQMMRGAGRGGHDGYR
jgi:hypothetical protein